MLQHGPAAHKQHLEVDYASHPNHKLRNPLHDLDPAAFSI